MKIGLVTDYYTPFTPGGSEWSVYYLSQSLLANNVENIILTPNYGSLAYENIDGVMVKRFPMYKKAKDTRSVINPIWQNNLFFFLWSSWWLIKIINEEKLDLLHVHGKFLIPGAVIAGKILRKPVIVTIRDKQLICSYGRCFFQKNRFNGCSFLEYLIKDLPWYYQHYVVHKNFFIFIYNFLAAIWTRISNNIIKLFAFNSSSIVTISKNQRKYMQVNGFKDIQVIYNSMEFPKLKKVNRRMGIVYAGKLSLGKGIYELMEAIPEVISKYKEVIVFAGSIEEKEKIDYMVRKLNIKKHVKFLGGINHNELKKLFETAKVVVMPSIYPESFGRVALEALASGTPVVVSDIGGIPEILGNKKIGVVSDVDPYKLAKSIIQILDNLSIYILNVEKSREFLRKKFEVKPIKDHVNLYNRLIHR